jgi:hypothetical protein
LFLASIAFVWPLYLSLPTKILAAASLTLIFSVSGSVILGFVSLALGLCVIATLHLILALPTGMWGLSQPIVFGIFSLSSMTAALYLNRLNNVRTKDLNSDAQDFLILSLGALLMFRWRVSGLANILGVLKAEDNGRWIMAASKLSSYSGLGVRPDSSAGGGYLLDYFISVVRFVTVGGSSKIDSDPATSYLVVANSYYIALLIVFVFVAGFASKFLENFGIKRYSLIAPLGLLFFLSQQMFRLFVNYGHLSFLVAMSFFWITCYLLLLSSIGTKSMIQISCLAGIASLGIMGGWWPLIPITISILIFQLVYQLIHSNFSRSVFVVFTSGFFLVSLLVFFLIRGEKSLSKVRTFYAANGGAIKFTEWHMFLCFLGLAVFAYLASEVLRTKLRANQLLFPFGALATYAIFLLLSSQFVGPNFFAGYSAFKVQSFFVIVTFPLLLISGILVILRSVKSNGIALSVLFIYVLTGVCFNSEQNFPRPIAQPTWAQTLINVVRDYPGSPIVCATSQESARLEAYACSRHASSISYRNSNENSEHGRTFEYIWRTMVVSHRAESQLVDFPIDKEFALFQRDLNSKVPIVISLDKSFAFMQADAWWMSKLPWDRFEIFEAETGKLIQGTNTKLKIGPFDSETMKEVGVGPGFIERIELTDADVKISGWADFGDKPPEMMVRNLKKGQVIGSQLFVRPDISNPLVRGFEISYKIANPVKNGYCPVLVLGTKHLALSSSDSEC